jgi:hypothetical protein
MDCGCRISGGEENVQVWVGMDLEEVGLGVGVGDGVARRVGV